MSVRGETATSPAAETAFTIARDDNASWVAIYNQQTGRLTLYRNGMVSVRDTLHDLELYATTRMHTGAPIEQVADRVTRWGRITRQRSIELASLSHTQYSALMRGEDVTVEEPAAAADLPAEQPTKPTEPKALAWKPGLPAPAGWGKAHYFESGYDGRTLYRVGGSAGRWCVVRFANGAGRVYRTPYVTSRERAVALLEQLTG